MRPPISTLSYMSYCTPVVPRCLLRTPLHAVRRILRCGCSETPSFCVQMAHAIERGRVASRAQNYRLLMPSSQLHTYAKLHPLIHSLHPSFLVVCGARLCMQYGALCAGDASKAPSCVQMVDVIVQAEHQADMLRDLPGIYYVAGAAHTS